MTKSYEFHPLADAFPLMTGQDFDELVADIKANGQREPIVIYDGKILDGRNRYRACVKLGIEPRMVQAHADENTPEKARAYVISANIRRRMLTRDEKLKSIEALLLAEPGASDGVIAERVGTYARKVQRVRKKVAGAVAGDSTKTSVQVDRRVGKDGKTRKVPAPKPAADPEKAQRKAEWSASIKRINAEIKAFEAAPGPTEQHASIEAPSQAEASAEQRKVEAREAEPADKQEDEASEFELGMFICASIRQGMVPTSRPLCSPPTGLASP